MYPSPFARGNAECPKPNEGNMPTQLIYLVTCTQEDQYDLPLFAAYSFEVAVKESKIWKESQMGNSYWQLDTIQCVGIKLLGDDYEDPRGSKETRNLTNPTQT